MPTRALSRWLLSALLACLTLITINLLLTNASAQARAAATLINCSGSIQACIDAANDGDTILLAAGRYTESLTLNKPVSLTGENRDTTIIHAVTGQRVLTVTGETISNSVVISELTFTGGNADYGGGMLITDTAQPLICDSIFVSNVASVNGGGIYTIDSLTLTHVNFISNTANSGGGLFTMGPTLTLIDSDFTTNMGGGAYAWEAAHVIGGIFRGNAGGVGGLSTGSPLHITGTQFLGNSGGYYASGVQAYGFATIVNARFENNACSGCQAGGLYFDGGENQQPLILTDSSFISNFPGGAYAQFSSNVTIIKGRFEGNDRSNWGDGGGFGAYLVSMLVISNSHFLSNVAAYGGGIGGDFQTANVTDSRFENNIAQPDNGGCGGGLDAEGGTVYLTNTQFINNTSACGGGMRAWISEITNSHFERNNAAYDVGGGLIVGDLFMSKTEFISNIAHHGGGGVFAGNTTVLGGHFENNHVLSAEPDGSATGGGGALLFDKYAERVMISDTQFVGNSAASFGGGIYFDSSFGTADNTQSRLANVLFTDNSAGIDGAALAFNATGHHDLLHLTIAGSTYATKPAIAIYTGTVGITDSIIASHTIAISNTDGMVYEDYNLFFNNITDTIGVTSGGRSLSNDPKFADPTNGNFHLRLGTIAIDHGIDAGVYTDLDGHRRPIGPGFDIGAYEYAMAIYTYLPLVSK